MEIKIGQRLTSDEAMALAIAEAYRGATRVSPNPLVGCVILDSEGGLLSKGHHEFYGGPHAEVNALKGLSVDQLKNAHVIVTLEPCAHEGKTPSCAKALAKLPIKKVTFGLVDPNPLVAGQGADIIRAAGIEAELFKTSQASLAAELELVCEAFLWNFRHQLPFVAVKVATSLDGQIALKNGESQWITGPEAREHVHYLRACYDAILVGRGTVQTDNPSLNIRHPEIVKINKVIVLDPKAELLEKYGDLKISQVHAAENVYWVVSEDVFQSTSDLLQKKTKDLKSAPQIVKVKTLLNGSLDLVQLLEQLYKFGIKSIFVEGGAQTVSQLISADKVNRLYVFQAPLLMGAGEGRSWTETLSLQSMTQRISVKNVKTSTFGSDLLWSGRLK